MTRLLFTLLIFLSTPSFGQSAIDIKKRAGNFQDSLIKNSVDTLLNYTLECAGYYSIDTCNFFDAHYIFWKQHDKTYLQRFDDCNIYKAILLDIINPLTFYIAQKKKIDYEIIYGPTYVESKHGDTVITIEQSIDHTCWHEMTFLTKKKRVIKNVSEYYLAFRKFENGRKNMYYNYNQRTQLKELIEQIKKLVEKLNVDKRFELK
jgi:hypothetical protein